MCNLDSVTRTQETQETQETMRRLFRVKRDLTGNLPGLPGRHPNTLARVVDAVEVFFDSITAKADVAVHPQFVQSEQKLAIDKLVETARQEVNQLLGFSEVSIQNLHLMVAATIEKGFEDRLAERWRNPPPGNRKALKKRLRSAKLSMKRRLKK